ncbi:uncharacterized protein [Epargyreus clarus]|uniref:uncharacterized protein isoform X2 n=1 Tax=Epargyreus clarus TaxID=520877 RepID=UPI003C2BC773
MPLRLRMKEMQHFIFGISYMNGINFHKRRWALRFGPMILGGINAMCGLTINKYYRHRFKLGPYGYLSSAIPICLMPGILTTLFHNYLISTDMLLMKSKSCPICYETKAAAIQSGFGLAYPLLLGSTAALLFANRYSSFRVPELTEGPKVMLKFLTKHTKPFTGTLIYMAAIQVAASSILTYFEMRNSFKLRHELLEIEKKLLQERGEELNNEIIN